MEHLIILPYKGNFKLLPEAGYVIMDTRRNVTHSVVYSTQSNLKYYVATPEQSY